jgi:hypothetical protein
MGLTAMQAQTTKEVKKSRVSMLFLIPKQSHKTTFLGL